MTLAAGLRKFSTLSRVSRVVCCFMLRNVVQRVSKQTNGISFRCISYASLYRISLEKPLAREPRNHK